MLPIKFYVASSFVDAYIARQTMNKIEEAGHEITCNWTKHKDISPYSENQALAAEYSEEDFEGVKTCQVFVLLTTKESSVGKHSELGSAITLASEYGKPEVYIVGHNLNESTFYFHPIVKRRDSIEEVIKETEKLL